jgi:hypothetical protein
MNLWTHVWCLLLKQGVSIEKSLMFDDLFPLHAPSNGTLKLKPLPGLTVRREVITFDLEQSPDDISV